MIGSIKRKGIVFGIVVALLSMIFATMPMNGNAAWFRSEITEFECITEIPTVDEPVIFYLACEPYYADKNMELWVRFTDTAGKIFTLIYDGAPIDNITFTYTYHEEGTYNITAYMMQYSVSTSGKKTYYKPGTSNRTKISIEVASTSPQKAIRGVKDTIDDLDTCGFIKKVLKTPLNLAIKFLNKADRFRENGKEKLANIMERVALLKLKIFQKIVNAMEGKCLTEEEVNTLISMTNPIIENLRR